MAGLHPPTVLPPWTPELHTSNVLQARGVVDAYLAPASRPKQFRDRKQVDTFFREVLGPSNIPVSDCSDKPEEQISAEFLASIVPSLFAAGYWCWESEAGSVPVMNAPQAAPVQRATSQTDLVAQPENEARSNVRAYESPSGSSISGGLTWQDSKDLRAEEIGLGSVQFQPVLDDPERILNLKVTLTMLHQDRRGHEHCHQQIEQLKAGNGALQLRIRDLEQPSYAPNSGEGIDRQPSLISTTEDLINGGVRENTPRSSCWPLAPRAADKIGPQKTTPFSGRMAPSLDGTVPEASTEQDQILRGASLLQRSRSTRFSPPGAGMPHTRQRAELDYASASSSPPIKSEPGLTEATEFAAKLCNTGGPRSTPRDEGNDAGEKKRRRFRYDLEQAQQREPAQEKGSQHLLEEGPECL